MSITTPTAQELAAQELADIEGELGQTTPTFSKAFLRVLTKAHAGLEILLYKYGSWIFRQRLARYASARETTIGGRVVTPLFELGEEVGAGLPLPGARAELVIQATVTSQGGELAAGEQLTNQAGSVIYEVVAPVPLSSALISVTIRAYATPGTTDGSGSLANLQIGDKVLFARPIAVATEATVTAVQVLGTDGEDIERQYRPRVMRRRARKPRGGSGADYQEWAEGVPGIANAYPYVEEPGVVTVYVEATPESSGSEDGIPTGGQLTAVLDAINYVADGKPRRRPWGTAVETKAITRVEFEVVVTGLSPDTPQNRTAIVDAVSDYLFAAEPYIEGLTSLPKRNVISEATVGGVVDDVASARGAIVTAVTITAPGPLYTLGNGEKAKLKLGTIYFN